MVLESLRHSHGRILCLKQPFKGTVPFARKTFLQPDQRDKVVVGLTIESVG